MTRRERIVASISHRQPDKVPVDLGATPSSGISAIAYSRLRQTLGMTQGRVRVYDVVQQLAQPEEWALDRFGVDVVDIGRTFNANDADWYDIQLPNGAAAQYPAWFRPERQTDGSWKAYRAGPEVAAGSPAHGPEDRVAVGRMPAGGTFYDQAHFPWEDGWPSDLSRLDEAMSTVVWSALVHSPWDNAVDPDFWLTLRNRALALRGRTDRALMIVVGCNLFEWGSFLRRLDNFLMDLLLEEASVERLLDALLERHLATLEKVCRAVGDVADIIRFGDDLGMDAGPFMSRELYQRLFKPRHAALCRYVREHSSMATFLHSCGSITPLIPDLIEAGFQILNPVQTNARDMEPERLKRDFGRDVVFWGGGVDTRTVLNRGTPREVRADVWRRLEVFSRDGGFVFNPVHNILPDVPPENIIAMFDAVSDFNGEMPPGAAAREMPPGAAGGGLPDAAE
jgi:uroporphyrinogen decarboxylase